MRIAMIIVVAAMACGAGPATTQPDIPALQKSVEDARAAVESAKADAIKRLEATPAYKAAAADAAVKQKDLADARENGTPQEKLDASSAYNKAKDLLDRMAATVRTNDRAVGAATKVKIQASLELANALQDQTEMAAKRQKELENDPVRIAIRKHKILKGMTPEDVEKSLSIFPRQEIQWQSSKTSNENADGRRIDLYHIGYVHPLNGFNETRTVVVYFKGGIVVDFSQTTNKYDNEPDSD